MVFLSQMLWGKIKLMNKITIVEDKTKFNLKDDILINKYDKLHDIDRDSLFIYLPPNSYTNLSILQINNKIYNKICILVDRDSYLNLLEQKILETENNYQYHFIINENSKLVVDKFYQVKKHQELINIDLIGINSQIDYRFRTVTNHCSQYLLNINHKNKQTKSYVNNRAITFGKANISFVINSYVEKGMRDSFLKQINKIMMLNDNKNKICPNLLIDEYSVIAKHGASIGKFDQAQLFYLQSRGISKIDSYHLLMFGFLAFDYNRYQVDEIKKRNQIINDMLTKVNEVDIV